MPDSESGWTSSFQSFIFTVLPRGSSAWLYGACWVELPVSASTVARLKENWHAELSQRRQRSLDDLEAVNLWLEGVYIKAGLGKEKAGILAALTDTWRLWLRPCPAIPSQPKRNTSGFEAASNGVPRAGR